MQPGCFVLRGSSFNDLPSRHSLGRTGGTGLGAGFFVTFFCSLANLGAGLALVFSFFAAGGVGGMKRSIS